MNLNEYQRKCRETAIYPDVGCNLAYPALKLAGEAGEVAEKIGKLMRDRGYHVGDDPWFTHFPTNDEVIQTEDSLIKELGDVLWYVSAMASELGVGLGYVAECNLEKLGDRKERDVLGGSGDNR